MAGQMAGRRSRLLLALFASFLLGLLAPVTSGGGQRMRAQLIGIAPSEGICRRKLQWVRLEWSNNTVEGVTLVDADLGSQGISATLGALSDIQFPPETPEKTCRLDPSGERLVCLGRVRESTPRDVGPAGLGGWCCADSLIIFSKDGSPQQIVDVQTPLRQALLSNGDLGAEEIASVNPSHSLELEPSSSAGRLTVLVMFEYDSLALSATDDQGNTVPVPDYGVAMFELDLNAGNVRVVPLANGAAAFLAFPNVGTLSNATLDTVYKVQYAIRDFERRALITGAKRFTDTKTGMAVMAYTHVFERATTIINDPWVSQDIKILQRFGTPPVLDPATGSQPDTRPGFRYFGLNQETEGALFGGVYNVWHTRYPGYNLDTITMFNVGGNGDSYVGPYIRNARVYEFAVALRPEGTNDVSDAVFETAYRRADLDFWALYMGGARPLEAGLYVVSSGKRGNSGFTGLKVVDSRGGIKQHSISTDKLCLDAAYDPFIFIEIDPETGESIAAPPRTFRSTVRRTDSMEGYQQRTGTSLYAWVSMLKHRGNA